MSDNDIVVSPLAATLPTEIVQTILVAGACDRFFGKPFAARSLRVAKWVIPCITPELYRTVDLWTETQAASFLSAIQLNKSHVLHRPRYYVQSVIINTAAFNANDTQSNLLPHMEVGRLTPGGVTTMTTFDILSSLSQGECPRWISVTAPMVILATRRYQPSPPIVMPRDVTITGVDSISWGAYDWSNLQKIRFTDYNLNLQDIRRLVTLPNLSHVAFAFYYDVPLGLFIIEELASSNKIQCVLVVIYVTQGRQEQDIKEQRKKMLQQLDEPKLVVWEDTPDSVDMMETEESDRLWKQVAAVVAAQTSEKQAALSRG